MEKNDKDYLQTFDALYTTNQIQIMKILLPYCSPDSRRNSWNLTTLSVLPVHILKVFGMRQSLFP